MPLSVGCPGCATQLVIAEEFVGQVLACPKCQTQFQVAPPDAASQPAPPVSEPAPSPAEPGGAPAAPRWRDSVGPSGGFKLNDPAEAAARAPAVVPRFIAADPSVPSVQLAQDGKLPGLALVEAQARAKRPVEGEQKSRPVLLTVALAVSMLLSVWLSLTDFSGTGDAADQAAEARRTIAGFYKDDGHALEPYQLLLREAQRANSRGDLAGERQYYRQVLKLLRVEHRTTSLTPTQQGDQELEDAIATVLRGE